MKKIFKLIYVALPVAILAIGCDDFLDVKSSESVAAEDSDEVYDPDDYLTAAYGMLTDWDYAFSWLGVTEIISDNADKGSSATDNGTDKNLLDGLTHTASTGSISAMWEHWYKSIGRCTTAISETEEADLEDTDYANRLIGEAKFLRALNYFYLVRMFGDVPLQHIDPTTRASTTDVYAFIEEDLLFAIENLPKKSEYDAADLGRATQGAAQSLLAKVYLYLEDWQNSYDYATTVINSGEYGLESDYAVLWRESSENGTESIFEVQARGDVIAHGVQQYSQTQGARGTDGWGWGFNVPSDDMLNAFNNAGDSIRRDATIIFAGETLWDGREISEGVENPMYNEKAYSSANLGSDDTDKNIRVIRLGEIYLIQAEAANELGNSSTALTALNTVRNRVYLDDVTTSDQSELRQAIWDERRLELAFEHDRWFDLIRTGQAGEVMRALDLPFVDGKHELFPIPTNQLVQTPEMEQNPNW